MGSAFLLMFLGTLKLAITCAGMIVAFLLIDINMNEAQKQLSIFSLKGFLISVASVFFGAVLALGFLSGLVMIDAGVKQMDSFAEVKK